MIVSLSWWGRPGCTCRTLYSRGACIRPRRHEDIHFRTTSDPYRCSSTPGRSCRLVPADQLLSSLAVHEASDTVLPNNSAVRNNSNIFLILSCATYYSPSFFRSRLLCCEWCVWLGCRPDDKRAHLCYAISD